MPGPSVTLEAALGHSFRIQVCPLQCADLYCLPGVADIGKRLRPGRTGARLPLRLSQRRRRRRALQHCDRAGGRLCRPRREPQQQ